MMSLVRLLSYSIFIPVRLGNICGELKNIEPVEELEEYFDKFFMKFFGIRVYQVRGAEVSPLKNFGVFNSLLILAMRSPLDSRYLYGCVVFNFDFGGDIYLKTFLGAFLESLRKFLDKIGDTIKKVLGADVELGRYYSYLLACEVGFDESDKNVNMDDQRKKENFLEYLPSMLFMSEHPLSDKGIVSRYNKTLDVSPWVDSMLFISERVAVAVNPMRSQVDLYRLIMAFLTAFEYLLLDVEGRFDGALRNRDLPMLRKLRVLVSSYISFVNFARRMSNEVYDLIFSEFLDRMEIDFLISLMRSRISDADAVITQIEAELAQQRSEFLNIVVGLLTIILSIPSCFQFLRGLGVSMLYSLIFSIIVGVMIIVFVMVRLRSIRTSSVKAEKYF